MSYPDGQPPGRWRRDGWILRQPRFGDGGKSHRPAQRFQRRGHCALRCDTGAAGL